MLAITSMFSSQNTVSFCPASFVLQGQICLFLQVFLDFHFCIPILCDEKDLCVCVCVCVCVLVLEGLYRISQLQFLWHQWLGHRFGTAVILYVLPWKRIKIILLFLRQHSSTAFWTLLLTITATPFFSKVFLLTVVDIVVF